MNPRESLAIAAAALRWSTARERRLAAGAEKRLADAAYKAHPASASVMHLAAARRLINAGAALAEAQRHERSATRALAKACAKTRGDLQAAEAFQSARPPVLLSPGMTLEDAR